MNLLEIADLLKRPCAGDTTISGVAIDSRAVKPGYLFFAIKGARLDGHEFVQNAITNGAVAVVCEHLLPNLAIPQFIVNDTVQALATIAASYRKTQACPAIALTGSNGKTTVKEMIAAILPQPAFATPGNLNNHLGAPLSVLQLNATHRYAVFELGANHAGEIAHTVAIVQPQVTLINNIAPAHIEGFGSIEGVANAKGEIHQGLVAGGTAVVNEDDAYAHHWDTILAGKEIIRFSTRSPTTIHAQTITLNDAGCAHFTLVTPKGEAAIRLQVPGLHSISNALAAASCTYALGIPLADIAAGLNRFTGVTGRMTFLTGRNAAVVIDDTYNANLRSVLTALDVLANCRGTRIFVFGDMGELGAWSQQHHQNVGEAAKAHGIDVLMTCGMQSKTTALAFGVGGKHYESQRDLLDDLLHQLNEKTTVLVKGSRSSAMEHIVHALVQ